MAYKYKTIAVGGTFDIIHAGHDALLSKAFESGERVIIGLTSNEFAQSSGKKTRYSFCERKANLCSHLEARFPGRNFVITELTRTFGPGIFTSDVQAIAVSSETAGTVEEANKRRRELGLPDLQIELVPIVLAQDGYKISSTRIRNDEIDNQGKSKRQKV